MTEDRNKDKFKFKCFHQQPVLPILQLQLPLRPLQSLLKLIHLEFGILYLLLQLLQHLEVWPDAVQHLQVPALPGHLGPEVQAAQHTLAGMALVSSSSQSSPPWPCPSWPSPCYILNRKRPQKRSVRFSKQQSHEPPLNIYFFGQKFLEWFKTGWIIMRWGCQHYFKLLM